MKRSKSNSNELKLSFLALSMSLAFASKGHCEDYYFDPSLFHGSAYGQGLEKFNSNKTQAGKYLSDIYLNGKLVKSGVRVTFDDGKGDSAQPCIPYDLAETLQIKSLPKNLTTNECRTIDGWARGSTWTFDQSSLKLMLNIPSAMLDRKPTGYIPVSEWDDGTTALFIRHNTNYSWTENTGSSSHYKYQYLWSGITAGTNLGLWQVRHQGNLRYVNTNVSGSSYHYNTVRTWVQRPIEKINSLLMLGDSYTESSLFGSLAFNGMRLSTDERMWPQSRRGYAPEVRGVASSDARVIVKQLGRTIYETTVPPGPFLIDDLNNTHSRGDLEVSVIEANGKTSTFTVPYSSVPESVRPGNWHYSVSLGRVRNYYSVNNNFFEGIVQKGVSNSITATAGARLAEDYQAWLLGGVLATPVGAFGVNTTFSDARVENDDKKQGWRAEINYSKSFDYGTNLTLAAYRYSTRGFRDLQDVLGVRRQEKGGTVYYSDTLNQRNRLSATLSQSFNEYGILSLSASTADYYNNQSRITQLQLGYNNSWRKISYGINVARQRTSWDYSRYNFSVKDTTDDSTQRKYTENIISLNISIPLDWGDSTSSVAFNYNQSKESKSSTATLSGSAGKNNDFSYSLYGGYERYNDSSDGHAGTFGGSVQENTSTGSYRASYGQGDNYRQANLGTSGTLVIHRGGVTVGPYSSETFALIHADGAQGARVKNGQGAVIDRFGYAILPSLTPYRENNVSLDTLEMSRNAELSGGSQRVVPYAGSVPQINFSTLKGRAILINITNSADSAPPMGAEVRDRDNTLVGVVGQGGQIYARVPDASGSLKVNWDDTGNKNCIVNYSVTGRDDDIVLLESACNKR
ncbi:fimbrial outer membrane usher protein [Erwiniaceae bacterium L1_54_6]|nr:fimbrial outer membrane usher protein [Erwiniaceae bacterium L1_54_6]